ncbi:hypothetical protein BRE01_49320 [Brevibacillus reuszeri]|uniref:HTH cro/C1-type domain-containing protein n=2 Tax=Brevibacillus reuszeri TaxID=54915 RepID=A0A0K9YLF9_9BACL|nr:hypothetical protein ADS79_27070 [Brevibacillus reuszeri]GED71230.1 hypothetical protein BRE01_49320 [Brevibacillus reuszeri]
MKDTNTKLGNCIRQKRLKKGFTLDQLSIRSGVNKGHISDIENGKVSMKLETMDALINALQTDYRNLYNIYLSKIGTVESCRQFIFRCIERNDHIIAKRGLHKLFFMSSKGRITTNSVDELVIFFDI